MTPAAARHRRRIDATVASVTLTGFIEFRPAGLTSRSRAFCFIEASNSRFRSRFRNAQQSCDYVSVIANRRPAQAFKGSPHSPALENSLSKTAMPQAFRRQITRPDVRGRPRRALSGTGPTTGGRESGVPPDDQSARCPHAVGAEVTHGAKTMQAAHGQPERPFSFQPGHATRPASRRCHVGTSQMKRGAGVQAVPSGSTIAARFDAGCLARCAGPTDDHASRGSNGAATSP